jgi:UDP-N-acetylglucosamine 2-epimerase (non-hydrolysing)
VLVTAHRRETWGKCFDGICQATTSIAQRFEDVAVLFVKHANPMLSLRADDLLGDIDRISLLDPQDYLSFVRLLDAATLVITDSGGIQEEATSLGKPTLVMRAATERPEAVDAGVAMLVGTDAQRIHDEAARLLLSDSALAEMSKAATAFGDGHAAERIAERLMKDVCRADE